MSQSSMLRARPDPLGNAHRGGCDCLLNDRLCRTTVRGTQVTTPTNYKETAPAAYTNTTAGTWQPAQPQDAALKGKWWEVFGEPELNDLEDQLNINNQTLAQYFQNFMAARAQVSQARASYFPTVTTTPSATRTIPHTQPVVRWRSVRAQEPGRAPAGQRELPAPARPGLPARPSTSSRFRSTFPGSPTCGAASATP